MPCEVLPSAWAAAVEHSNSNAASSCALRSVGLAKALIAFTKLNL